MVIKLENLSFMACHGVLPEEKITPQQFILDVAVHLTYGENVDLGDNLEKTLNYVQVYDIIKHIMMQEQYDLIESICLRVGKKIVTAFPQMVESVNVAVTKVNPPIEGFVGTVKCEELITNGE